MGVLLQGWLGILAGNFAWCANVFWLISSIMYLRVKRNAYKKIALYFSIVALFLGLSCHFYRSLPSLTLHSSDIAEYIYTYQMGYYFWLASFLILSAGQLKEMLDLID